MVARKTKGISTVFIGLAVVVTLIAGVGTGWILKAPETTTEVASLQNSFNDLQDNFYKLQEVKNTLQENYENLSENHANLEQSYDELIENLKPSFPSESTKNQVIAWDHLRIELSNAHVGIGSSHLDGYINLLQYETAHDYIAQLASDLIKDIEAIRENASINWNASIDKFIETAEWDIKGFENYALYLETDQESYYSFYNTCFNNGSTAQDDAWALMPT